MRGYKQTQFILSAAPQGPVFFFFVNHIFHLREHENALWHLKQPTFVLKDQWHLIGFYAPITVHSLQHWWEQASKIQIQF